MEITMYKRHFGVSEQLQKISLKIIPRVYPAYTNEIIFRDAIIIIIYYYSIICTNT